MSSPNFIIGLPRSRTAWLSVFMAQSGARWHHDGLNGCNSVDEYNQKVTGSNDSSTGLAMLDINKLYPLSKVVIIKKSQAEFERCVMWCNDNYNIDSSNYMAQLNERLLLVNGLVVNQSDINERLSEIWAHLTDKPWLERYRDMVSFNVQVQSIEIDNEAARNLIESIQ